MRGDGCTYLPLLYIAAASSRPALGISSSNVLGGGFLVCGAEKRERSVQHILSVTAYDTTWRAGRGNFRDRAAEGERGTLGGRSRVCRGQIRCDRSERRGQNRGRGGQFYLSTPPTQGDSEKGGRGGETGGRGIRRATTSDCGARKKGAR